MRREGGTRERSDIQRAALAAGVVFLLVTIVGFIPGLTTDYDRLTTFDDVGAKIFGIFGTNILENIVHLLYALAGFAAAVSFLAARNYFVWGGAVLLVVWIYGLVIDLQSSANFIGVNTAANWLHFVLGLAMIGIGVLLGRRAYEHRAVTA